MSETVSEQYTQLKLSNLRVVVFEDFDPNMFRTLFLFAPAVKSLELRSFIGVSRLTRPLFPNLYRLMPSLTSLSLINFAVQVDDLLDLLRASQNLINFEFAGSNNDDHELLFTSMNYVRSSNEVEVLLPKLDRLSLHVPALGQEVEEAFPVNTFVDMIKSRRNAELLHTSKMGTSTLSCLSHLTFSARDKHAIDEVKRALTPYCDDGLSSTFNVITNIRWGWYNRYRDLEHWY